MASRKALSFVWGAMVFAPSFHLSDWTPLPLSMMGRMPQIDEEASGGWHLKGHHAAGGYGYLFSSSKEPVVQVPALPVARWSWSVRRFPSTFDGATLLKPDDKSRDDYALRVGFLFSQRASKHSLPLPPSLARKLKKHGEVLTHVLFFSPVPQGSLGGQASWLCSKSPQNSQIVNCLKELSSNATPQKVEVDLFEELKKSFSLESVSDFHLLGLWLVSDGDDSKSDIEATLSPVVFRERSSAP